MTARRFVALAALHGVRAVRRAVGEKNVSLDLDSLLCLDGEVRELRTRADTLRRQRNEISASFKTADPSERPALGARAKEMGARAGEIEAMLAEKSAALEALMLRLPGIPWEGAPVGPDESFNTVVRREGEPRSFDFEPLDHVALIERNDWADLARWKVIAAELDLRNPADPRAALRQPQRDVGPHRVGDDVRAIVDRISPSAL